MRDEDRLEDLPEAVPLHRIAPFWRLVAILATLAVVGLSCVTLILGITLVNTKTSPPIYAPPPAPMMRVPAIAAGIPAAAGGGPGVDDEAEPDAPNLPYPVKADLIAGDADAGAEANPSPPAKAPSTARDRFLDKGTDVWNLKKHLPQQLVISPDGEHMAYISGGNLTAGPIGAQRQLVGNVIRPAPNPVMPGRIRGGYPAPMAAYSELNVRLIGPPSWSPDNGFLYCADASGHLRRYDLQGRLSDGTANWEIPPFDGASTAPVAMESDKLVFVRTVPRPKFDPAGQRPMLDLTEVVLGDLNTKEVRVLVPASTSAWNSPAVSPDGKRLALVSDRGHEGERSEHLRVFVLDLDGGEPKAVSPAASQLGSVCWTADGKGLIYARSQDPPPPDHWESEATDAHAGLDLHHYDFEADRETRLSRGGGCFSPSVSSNGDLYYLAVHETGNALLLRRVSLVAAHEFASQEPQGIVRDAAAWTSLFHSVLEETKVAANLDGAALTPEGLARTFDRLYRKQFQSEPPSTLKGLVRQRRELRKLNLSSAVYPALTLILGAVEGEYLVRQHGARWHLTKGPLVPPEGSPAESNLETPFAYVANPFAAANEWARQSARPRPPERDGSTADESPVSLLRKAEGRTLVLTNNPAAAQAIVAELTDPDLDRAIELLQQGKAEAAEPLFLELAKWKRHERNMHLALLIGGHLYEKKRLDALSRLMDEQANRPPLDARKFELLGLAFLDTEPRQAIEAFKNALRCDLRCQSAYLNLSLAYQRANDNPSARMCLQRYLALMPDGVYAADARRRLAAVETTGP